MYLFDIEAYLHLFDMAAYVSFPKTPSSQIWCLRVICKNLQNTEQIFVPIILPIVTGKVDSKQRIVSF